MGSEMCIRDRPRNNTANDSSRRFLVFFSFLFLWYLGLRDYYNNWRIIMDDNEELVKYSKELEEDLERELVSVFCTLYMGDC